MIKVRISGEEIVAENHAGNTGVCIAVSTAVQVAARMLNEAGCAGSVSLQTEPPLFRVRVKGNRRDYVSATLAALASVIAEIQEMNPGLISLGCSGGVKIRDSRRPNTAAA